MCRLYVLSVDGVLSALDWEGTQMWSHQLAEPLFSSTLNYKVCVHAHIFFSATVEPGSQDP